MSKSDLIEKNYLRERYRKALMDYRLGVPGAIDELFRITITAALLYGNDFTDRLKETYGLSCREGRREHEQDNGSGTEAY